MDLLLPWPRLCAIVEQHWRDGDEQFDQRFPAGIERLLRVCFLQSWFGLTDRACEEALIDSVAFQRFARMDRSSAGMPDARAIQRFRSLLQSHDCVTPLLAEVNGVMAANGIRVKAGTISNARIVANLSSSAADAADTTKAADTATHADVRTNTVSYGEAYRGQSMRFRQAPAASSTPGARTDARVAQAIANIERIANFASRPVPLPGSANR